MISSISFVLLSLIYIIVLELTFFRKKHVKSNEIRIYSAMLITNSIGLMLEIVCYYGLKYIGEKNIIIYYVNKIFLIYYIVFLLLFFNYLISIIFQNATFQKLKKLLKILAASVLAISSILILALPIYFGIEDGVYSYGPAVNIVYFLMTGVAILFICMYVFNFKNIDKKKTIPILVFVFGTGIVGLVQKFFPEITLSTPMESLVLFIMYHTIENPDISMINELEKARDEADRANRAKSDFLSSMSHEIRTPLNAIIGFSEFIIDTNDIDDAHAQAKDVVSASQTLLETVNGILDLSKVESGKLEIINDNYNVRDLLDSTVRMAKARLGDKKLDLRVHFAEDLPDTLYGDKGNLNKVIINLLTNAIKYTNEGYIDYSVQCATNSEVCRLIITVKDTGIGIKKENIDKLFTRFQRFDEKNNGTIEGTGLGLAITKQLVEMMGGNIVVSSIYGEGSNFTVALDQRISLTHVESKSEGTEVNSKFDFHDKKVLIVDDNNLNLKLGERLFARYNCKPTLVSSGFDCLDLINKGEKFDLILLDDVMPKMLGSETLTRLKRIEEFDTPVVALTANAISGMREKYLLLGFDDYLAKPIEKENLEVILKKFLVNKTKAKKLDETQLSSSKPVELVTETVKNTILNSAASKDVVLVEKDKEEKEPTTTTTTTIVGKNVEEVKTEVKEEPKEESKVEGIQTTTTGKDIQVSLPNSEEYTDYSNRRILVVDDNKLNLKVALKFLSRYKFKEDEAYSGEECLNKVKSGEKYDIIFMDIMMPNMNGVETFHELQKIDGFNTPVVVALTADAVEGAQERYLGEGFAEYISKPIVRERLDKVIHEILDNKE